MWAKTGKHAAVIWVQETTRNSGQIITEVQKMGLSYQEVFMLQLFFFLPFICFYCTRLSVPVSVLREHLMLGKTPAGQKGQENLK